jgi:hypothetical protein
MIIRCVPFVFYDQIQDLDKKVHALPANSRKELFVRYDKDIKEANDKMIRQLERLTTNDFAGAPIAGAGLWRYFSVIAHRSKNVRQGELKAPLATMSEL